MVWLSPWIFRKLHTITGTVAGQQTNYQVGIKVYYGAGVDGTETVDGVIWGKVYCDSKCETDFADIRFTASDGKTLLDYWLEDKVDSDYALFWVKIPSIPISPGTVDIYVYYGNSLASDISDIDATFIFGDDFPGAALDTNKWEITYISEGDGTLYEVTGGEFHIYVKSTGVTHGYRFDTKNSFNGPNFRVKSKGRFADLDSWRGSGNWYSIFLVDDDGDITGWGIRLWGDNRCTTARYLDGSLTNYIESNYTSGTVEQHYEVEGTEFDRLDIVGRYNRAHSGTVAGFSTPFKLRIESIIAYWTDTTEVDAYYDFVVLMNYADPEPAHTSWDAEENQPTLDLFAEFGVKQWQEDLKAEFLLRQETEDIFAKAIITRKDTQDLFAKLIVRHAMSEDLQSETVVRHSGSVDLCSKFRLRQGIGDLKAIFIVRHLSSADLKSEFELQFVRDLHCEFTPIRSVPDPTSFEVFGAYLVEPLISTQDDVVRNSHQRKTWYANGRHWIFGVMSRDFQYWHSLNGQSWAGPIKIKDVTEFEAGYQISTWVDNQGYLHYSYANGSANGSIMYRKGFLESNGTITWVAAEQTAYNPPSDVACPWPTIAVDVNGYPWIAFYRWDTSPDTRELWVTKSDTKNGTWTTNPNYPALISSDYLLGWIGIPCPLANGQVVIWGGGNNATKWYAAVCDNDGAQTTQEQSSAGEWDTWYTGGAIAVRNVVYAAYGATGGYLYLNKFENGSWGTEEIIQTTQANQCPTFFRNGTFIFVVWTDMNEFRYKVSRDAGASWRPLGVNNHSVLFAASAIDHPVRITMGVEPRSLLGWAYNHTNDDLYYVWLETVESPELFAKFEVGQGSADLKAVFRTTQEVLFAKALIVRPGFEDLFCKLVVRQSDSTELFAKLELAQWEDLYCKLRVRKILNFEGSLGIGFKWWGAGGMDQMVDFEMWSPTGFWVTKFPDGDPEWRWIFLTFKDVPGSTAVLEERGIDGSRPDRSQVTGIFWTYHSEGVRRIDGIYIWRAAELKAIFNVRHPGVQNLYAKFEAQVSMNLKAEFTVIQPYVDLKAVFIPVRRVADLKCIFEVNHFDFFGPWLVLSTNPENVAYPHQEKVFRWGGRHWIFYEEPDYDSLSWGPDYYYMFYKTSVDGQNWSTQGIIPVDGLSYGGAIGSVYSGESSLEGRMFSVWVNEDDGIVHIAVSPSDGFGGNDLFYKRGTMSASGAINWDPAVTAMTISSVTHCKWPTICCDVNGYPYITWYEQSQQSGQGELQNAYIVKSDTKDGTFTPNTNYHDEPYGSRPIGRMSTNTQIRYIVKPVPLANGKVFAFYGGDAEQWPWYPYIIYPSDDEFHGRACDGNGMGAQASGIIGSPWQVFYGGAAIADGNDVIAAVTCEDQTLRVCKWSNGSWGTSQLIQTGIPLNTTPILFKIPGGIVTNDKIVVAWIDETNGKEVRYKLSSDGGDTWHPNPNTSYCVLMQYPTGFGTGGDYQPLGYWGKLGVYTIHSWSMRYEANDVGDIIGFAFNNTLDQLMFGYIRRAEAIGTP